MRAVLAALLLASTIGGASAVAAQAPSEQLEVILAIDTSGSMRPALDATKAAANEFVAAIPGQVRIGIVGFGDVVTLLAPPTSDRDVLAWTINSLVVDGDTALYDAIVVASQQFTPTVQNKVLVVLSDGKDEGSSATLQDAIAATQGIQVEAISLTTSETDINSLLALGPVTSADDAAGVSAAFARVADLVVEVAQLPPPGDTVAPTTTVAPSTAPETTVAVATTPPPPAIGSSAVASPSSTRLWIGGIGVFAGLFGLGLMLFPRSRVSKARLGIAKPRNVSELGARTVSAVDEALERHGKRADLATTLAVADISMRPAEFVATVGIVAVVAGLVGLALGGLGLGLLLAVALCLFVRYYVRRNKAKRQASFADQLPDVLQLLVTALRSGFGIVQALESVAEEAEEPARSEFAHVLVETRLGRDLSDSMRALAERMESRDLEWVVAAIDINRDTGGNLSEILNTVSTTVRERGKMAREVRTLTAEGRLSARVLIALPIVMALWQWRFNSDNFELLTHGPGLVAAVIAVILMALGIVWVRQVVKSVSL